MFVEKSVKVDDDLAGNVIRFPKRIFKKQEYSIVISYSIMNFNDAVIGSDQGNVIGRKRFLLNLKCLLIE